MKIEIGEYYKVIREDVDKSIPDKDSIIFVEKEITEIEEAKELGWNNFGMKDQLKDRVFKYKIIIGSHPKNKDISLFSEDSEMAENYLEKIDFKKNKETEELLNIIEQSKTISNL